MTTADRDCDFLSGDDLRLERYLTGRLEPGAEAACEEHFLGCPRCLDQLEVAERMLAGLRRAAAEDAARVMAAGVAAHTARQWGWRIPVLVAGLLTLAVLPSALLLRSLADRDARLERVEMQLAEARAPQANTLLLDLNPHRGIDPTAPVYLVRLGLQSQWVTVSLQLDRVDLPRYHATLYGPTGSVLGQADDLVPNQLDALAISIHSSRLEAGDHVLQVTGRSAGGGSTPISRFTFRVERGALP